MVTALLSSPAMVDADTIRIGGTTSVRESGLLAALEAGFRRDTGDQLQFIVGGTGRVLKLLEAQDVSGALVHDTDSEQALLDADGAAERFDVMRNDYIILGQTLHEKDAEILEDLRHTFRAFVREHYPEVRLSDVVKIAASHYFGIVPLHVNRDHQVAYLQTAAALLSSLAALETERDDHAEGAAAAAATSSLD